MLVKKIPARYRFALFALIRGQFFLICVHLRKSAAKKGANPRPDVCSISCIEICSALIREVS